MWIRAVVHELPSSKWGGGHRCPFLLEGRIGLQIGRPLQGDAAASLVHCRLGVLPLQWVAGCMSGVWAPGSLACAGEIEGQTSQVAKRRKKRRGRWVGQPAVCQWDTCLWPKGPSATLHYFWLSLTKSAFLQPFLLPHAKNVDRVVRTEISVKMPLWWDLTNNWGKKCSTEGIEVRRA